MHDTGAGRRRQTRESAQAAMDAPAHNATAAGDGCCCPRLILDVEGDGRERLWEVWTVNDMPAGASMTSAQVAVSVDFFNNKLTGLCLAYTH